MGVAVAGDEAELAAAHEEVERSQTEASGLEATIAEIQGENSTLAASLEDAEAGAETAGQEGAAKERRLSTRAAKLDEREAELDSRETELDGREAELSDTESSVGVEDDSALSSSDDASLSDFDRDWADDIAADIVEDIRTVDHRLEDGGAVESGMYLLSGNFPRLLDAGIPPGVDEPQYVARLQTLEAFTNDAADLYSTDPMEGTAKYTVVRKETGVLLKQLNAAIGTDFRLP